MLINSVTKFIFLTIVSLFLTQGPIKADSNHGFAVVLIDMQEGFYQRGGTEGTEGLKHLVLNQSQLLKWSVQNNIPVLVFEYEGLGKTDSKLMNILLNHKFRVIEKDMDGGFYGKSRAEALKVLKNWNVDSLIVAGINGPYCVKETIEGALENGFDVMTTAWVIGNINFLPPVFPNGSWYFKNNKFTVFPTLESIIR